MIGLAMFSRAPQTVLSLGGLKVPFPQNVRDIRTLTVEAVNVPNDTFLPCQFEGNNFIIPSGNILLIGQAMSVTGKDAFILGHASNFTGDNFIPIIGAMVFSNKDLNINVLELLTPVDENRVVGCFAVKPNMSIASTLYCQIVPNLTLENQPTIITN